MGYWRLDHEYLHIGTRIEQAFGISIKNHNGIPKDLKGGWDIIGVGNGMVTFKGQNMTVTVDNFNNGTHNSHSYIYDYSEGYNLYFVDSNGGSEKYKIKVHDNPKYDPTITLNGSGITLSKTYQHDGD